MLAAGGLGGNYVTLTWLATYLKTVRHLSVLGTGGYLGINIFGSFLGYVISAHLSDWLGRRKTFVLMACAAAVTVACYTLLPLSNTAVLLLGFPLGFFQSGIIAGMGATFAELFPTRVPRDGPGILVQHRPGHRFVRSDVGGRAGRGSWPWPGHGALCRPAPMCSCSSPPPCCRRRAGASSRWPSTKRPGPPSRAMRRRRSRPSARSSPPLDCFSLTT